MARRSRIFDLKIHGQSSLAGYSPGDRKQWDPTEGLSTPEVTKRKTLGMV